jgi:hypothetical protein
VVNSRLSFAEILYQPKDFSPRSSRHLQTATRYASVYKKPKEWNHKRLNCNTILIYKKVKPNNRIRRLELKFRSITLPTNDCISLQNTHKLLISESKQDLFF